MLPGRFNFGDPDTPQPRANTGWRGRILALVLVLTLAALAQILDLGRLLR
jgi:hypothetical protein